MPSSITTVSKKTVLDLFRQDLESDDAAYYAAFSSADSSESGLFGQNQFRNEMNFIKVVSGKSFVVPNNTWTSGTVYKQYDDNDDDQTLFYVINSLNEVFLCVETPRDADNGYVELASEVEPTVALATAYNSTSKTFKTSDRYLWRYLYKLTGLAASSFKTLDYMPVQKIAAASSVVELSQQFAIQEASIPGQIINIAIDSGGTGYSFIPRITINGNGTGASFSATIEDGSIVSVAVDSDGNRNILHGSGYNFAELELSVEGDASLRAVMGPIDGVNADPVETLRSNQFMIQTRVEDNESGAIVVADPVNDFKQVGLLRNPKKNTTDSDFTAFAGNCMNYFELTDPNGTFAADELFTAPSGATGKTYWHDTVSSPDRLYYTRNHTTGFKSFEAGADDIEGELNTASGSISADVAPTVNRYSGQLLYINNLETSIERTSTQTEDIKIVIDLG